MFKVLANALRPPCVFLHHFIIVRVDDDARMDVNLVVVAHIQNIVFLNFSNAVTPDIPGLVTINSEGFISYHLFIATMSDLAGFVIFDDVIEAFLRMKKEFFFALFIFKV
ncbi:hypothetical protein HYE53_04980 [Aggregatibacter actinomycetemcomitans]|nr:hypothetical protein [Aggregatibacter actinomycetemcomitans]